MKSQLAVKMPSLYMIPITYGFPIEMTQEIVHEYGFKVDENAFRAGDADATFTFAESS